MVDRAEQYLMDRGFRQVRVRVHGSLARIEVAQTELHRLLDADLRAEVSDFCLGLGFRYVCLDLAGYRTGSMNMLLPSRDCARNELIGRPLC